MGTIEQIISSENLNVSISVTAGDLKHFANTLLQSAMKLGQQPIEEEDQLLTVEEAIERLKISRTSAWRWERQGILKPVKIGRFVRYRKSDIDELINKGDGK